MSERDDEQFQDEYDPSADVTEIEGANEGWDETPVVDSAGGYGQDDLTVVLPEEEDSAGPAQRVAGGVSARIVQNLDKGGKGLVALALVAVPLERDHATVACGRHCLVRETRLSDARLTADQEQRSGPSESFLHRLVELVELVLTAD